MRTLRFLLQKEFKQIFRNRALLPMIFITPLIQLLVMPLAIDYQVKNINIAVVDHDRSSYSRKLIDKVIASGYFKLVSYGNSNSKAFIQIEKDKADLILEIPERFEKDLIRENQQQVFIAANAINGTTATLGSQYLGAIIADFNTDVRMDWVQPQRDNAIPTIHVASSNWFNPFLNYPFFMVPGILVTLVTMIGAYMCALNIVKEKEIGTIEQVNVTPIKKYHFILGKMIPFWLIGNFVFSIGFFVVARLIYGIVPAGSVLLIYAFLGIFLIAVLGIGLLISTYSETQQQAMSLAFFCMMIFMLMSGLFTSVDSMPGWAKIIARCSPVTYFVEVMRMVVLKGSSLSDIKAHFAAMTGFAVLFNGWAILNYKKTS
jgi:ABC-2 type transport system permease protein